MTSLSEVYTGEGRSGEHRPDLRRLYAGVGLFLVGALLVLGGILVAATDVLYTTATVEGITNSRHVGGVLGGIGVPAVFLGVLTVLPSARRTRAAALLGASIAVLGVGLFWHAYPCQWSGSNCGAGLMDLTLPTVGVYFFGLITTFWWLFVGIANFKTRNAPGGTVRMEVTRQGETKIVEVPRGGASGVGFLGSQPDGGVETQTGSGGSDGTDGTGDRASWSTSMFSPEPTSSPPPTAAPASESSSRSATQRASSVRASPGDSTTASDGGASASDIRSPLDASDDGTEFVPNSGDEPTPRQVGDTYCGSCQHFDYVRTDTGIQPYCGLHDDLMDDMEACEEWTPR
ncbi:DUF7139 domain-containing protein [Salinigranum marinum]|uniref:DUF7139 domain-containing protein n=1 Tax=Salinigranum marinum TaxID=1515595 RepID=UPI002989F1E1|nr:ribonuclease BN [Salinigranum marinum]